MFTDAKTLPGVSGPFGFFDPLNLSATASPVDVKRWRESELTHGRVCMLAAVGFLVGENLEDVPLFFNWDGSITGTLPLIRETLLRMSSCPVKDHVTHRTEFQCFHVRICFCEPQRTIRLVSGWVVVAPTSLHIRN